MPIIGDTAVEPNEFFNLTLSAPSGATIADGAAIGTINNDDSGGPPPTTISVADASLVEGNTGTTMMSFAVTLSASSTSTVTVNFATSTPAKGANRATANVDYTTTTGTVTFDPGETADTILVPIIGDTAVEPNEFFNLTLSAPSGATIADGAAIGTINNDD